MPDFISQKDYDHMERIDSDLMDKVLSLYDRYDPTEYTEAQVRAALCRDSLTIDDFGALLSPAAGSYLEQMAQKAQRVNRKQFGNSVCLYTPLYIANYCTNHCVYCGFNCKNHITRGKLTLPEIETEFKAIASTGLREILILTGESRVHSDLPYIGEAVELAKQYFSTIGIEIYPLNTDEYAFLHEKGADFVSVYQETYNREKYREVHLSGPKRDFSYRFNAQERAILGGMRGVSVGALLGLDNFRKDAFAAGLHAKFLQQKYPHAEVSFSVPRMRPYKNNEKNNPNDVHEPQLLQVMLAFRLFLPFAGISISTRERAGFRDHVMDLCATRISAGSKTGVGGHEEEAKGDEQFVISDPRGVEEIRQMLRERGMQEVFTDYIRL
ncbi:MAG: 2-iminoacetate synthase ThiH [Oscillospiraceae bacterium]|nr:2-iminoacetate synthase ThiH [Oscillospiraceae bacterium]